MVAAKCFFSVGGQKAAAPQACHNYVPDDDDDFITL